MTKRGTYRFSEMTDRQIRALVTLTGLTMTSVVSIAIDRMYQQENKTMNTTQAQALAIKAIQFADEEGQPVADTTVVGKDTNGYWVTDNGEEVSGLTKEEAIKIIVENLTNE